ncbi:MAG: hypothetical protein KF757_08990 [Phycisphaeraceae bacterium]|nr:hypothetical protein [Phycisphaeraceae bacterium]MCW5762889.1 hypothetical protein [Phycisphaeraceae bacterium]
MATGAVVRRHEIGLTHIAHIRTGDREVLESHVEEDRRSEPGDQQGGEDADKDCALAAD